MQKKFEVTIDEYLHFSKIATSRASKAYHTPMKHIADMLFWCFLGMSTVFLTLIFVKYFEIVNMMMEIQYLVIICVVLFIFVDKFYCSFKVKNYIKKMPKQQGTIVGQFEFIADNHAIEVCSKKTQSKCLWTIFNHITWDNKCLIFWLAPGEALILPISAFDNQGEIDQLITLSGIRSLDKNVR